MDFRFTPEQEAYADDLRAFFEEKMAAEGVKDQRDPTQMYRWSIPFERKMRRETGEAGHLGVAWPEKYGGRGKDMVHQAILGYEAAYADAPAFDMGVSFVAAPLMLFGSEEQKAFHLPKILSGEARYCLGYSEPGAGSDLASLQTSAVQDGDEFVINGQKIFTTQGHDADYCWLAARTDPEAPKHKGVSVILMDMKSPGVTVRPLWTMAKWRHNEVFFDNVRVPKTDLVGELHRGWYQVAAALDVERSSFPAYGEARHWVEALVKYCKTHWRDGKPLSQDPIIRQKLARLATQVAAGYRLSMRVAWLQSRGDAPNYEASVTKVYGSELRKRIANTGYQILGHYGNLEEGSPHAQADGVFFFQALTYFTGTIGAGANEIQRNIIAQRGLGMPR